MKKNIFYDIILIIFYSCFPVIYLFSFNFQKYLSKQYEYFNVLSTCLLSSVIFLVAYIIIGIIAKKHARVITILLVFFFYSFGDAYNVIENLVTFHIKIRYFLLLYLLFFTAILFLLIRINKSRLILFCILIYVVPVLNIVIAKIQHVNVDNTYLQYEFSDNYTKRNVYYIILDGFINLDSYKEQLPSNYNSILSKLDDMGMTPLNNTWTAYPNTIYSIPSTLNLNYINSYNNNESGTNEFSSNQYHLGSNNLVYKIFNDLKYKIIINSNHFVPTNSQIKYDYYDCERLSEFQELLFDNSIVVLADYYIKEHFSFQIKSSRANEILCQFEKIQESEHSDHPKFVFTHIYCPHPPYVFKKNGERINSRSSSSIWKPEEEYYEQLEYCSTLLMSSLESLLKNYENQLQPIIIVQSDHGPHLLDANLDFNNLSQHLRILNIQYLPGQKISFEEEINVNTFRKIFTHYFGMNFDYLQKHVFVTSTYLGNDQELKFINVDSLIDKSL